MRGAVSGAIGVRACKRMGGGGWGEGRGAVDGGSQNKAAVNME